MRMRTAFVAIVAVAVAAFVNKKTLKLNVKPYN